MKARNFRKRSIEVEDEDQDPDHEKRLALSLEEVKFLQRQREKKSGIPALPTLQPSAAAATTTTSTTAASLARSNVNDKNEGDIEKDDLVLQDTFAQETAVMVEDPNMLRYVEQELAKKRGKNIDEENQVENEVKRAEDELYKIPEHLKVKKRSSEENSTQWTTGIAEVQLPIEYKLRNIEETEAAKKLLQEKRLVGRTKADSSIPSSFSADFFQRGKDYAEKLRKEHPELYKDKGANANGLESKNQDSVADGGGRRQAATDEFMLERFRKRERQRLIRR
ncbi:integrator complex subunit-like protein [Perilla frutescens var. hirtella]|uniref:Integrator complex subunit-like protein n=1 Tax=Perilla frutescens var. hirtella TaxID=608512 RepID=A0AAD4JFI6_PERFH|nr:integrator complex subunit-like protein [Perilla frutescens var. hirtella]